MNVQSAVSLVMDSSVQTVALGAAAVGAVSGGIGSLAVVRRQSLQGDAISHAALLGVAGAFCLGGRSELSLILGAAAAGWLAMMLVGGITRGSRIPFDTALAGTMAVFFGLGLTVISWLQRHSPDAASHGLERYLFGQAAFIREGDLQTILGLGGAAVAVLILGWKEFKLVSFDADFAASLGIAVRRTEWLLTLLIVVAVVIGLQTVGVVLMSTLIVAPAVAARWWCQQLGPLAVLAAGFGAAAGWLGTIVSVMFDRWLDRAVPPGPSIVLLATGFVVVSMLVAPGGLIRSRSCLRVGA